MIGGLISLALLGMLLVVFMPIISTPFGMLGAFVCLGLLMMVLG